MFPLPTAARSALRHDQAAALPVDLDDLNRNHLSDEGCQVSLALIRRHFARQGRDVRCGHEAAQLAEDDLQATGVVTADLSLEHLVVVHHLLGNEPILFLQRARERNDQVPFPVGRLENVHRPGCAFLNFRQSGFLQPAQIVGRHDRFSFQAEIDDDLLRADRDDRTLANIASLGHVIPSLVEQGLHGMDLSGWLGGWQRRRHGKGTSERWVEKIETYGVTHAP